MTTTINLQENAWRLILAALEDEHWEFRSVEGIASETGLDQRIVREQIELHKDEVRCSLVKDTEGRELYTAKHRKVGWRELLRDIHVYATRSFLGQ